MSQETWMLIDEAVKTSFLCYYYYYYYYYHHHHQIYHFWTSAGKHSPILGCAINRNRLGGLIYNLKSFLQLNMFQELRIFAFVCTYSDAGCLFRFCGSDFGIIPVDDITNGITWAVFCFHIAHISFPSSLYLFCLSVIVLARLCVFGTVMSIKKLLLFLLLLAYLLIYWFIYLLTAIEFSLGTPVQIKQIKINVLKRNNTKTQYK